VREEVAGFTIIVVEIVFVVTEGAEGGRIAEIA